MRVIEAQTWRWNGVPEGVSGSENCFRSPSK
jgi:hypothetical protein